ncbi:MAG TPA: class I SAM-dependent methyltransferase [Actinomycetota bacterium]|nr:class I SAM-dependent methyltransferase [Actinomycetota bacterium]
MGDLYDKEHIARVFDAYGDQEWNRHESSPMARVSFHIHLHYLRQFVRQGDLVLEVGAGAGRFTVELARLGARVTATDISGVQLDLNRMHVTEAGLEDQIEAWAEADVVDLVDFADGSFDVTSCFGGPLSYAMDRVDDAVHELLRVTKPGGLVLVSVMSNMGTLRAYLGSLAEEWESYGAERWQAIFETGDLPAEQSSTGRMHMYRWAELRDLLERHGADVVAASAANFLSAGTGDLSEAWLPDPARWEQFLDWEVSASSEPGALDGGTHIIAVIRGRT